MPGKMARSDPRPPSGLPVVAAVVRAANPPFAKHRIFVKISASLGVIRAIPDQSFHAHSARWYTPPD